MNQSIFFCAACAPVTMGNIQMFDTNLPVLRGTHALLVALSLPMTRDLLSTEEMSDALTILAGHIEVATEHLMQWRETTGLDA